ILQERNIVEQRMSRWKQDIAELDAIVRGDLTSLFTPQTQAERFDAALKVQNVVLDALMDSGRSVAESMATVRTRPIGRATRDESKARRIAAIDGGYHEANDGEDDIEAFGQDLAGAGGAFQR